MGSARGWVALAAIVRLGWLVSMPVSYHLIEDRQGLGGQISRQPAPAAWEFLQHRTHWKLFTPDEPAYDDIARNLVGGRGFVLNVHWVVNTPGAPTMYAGAGYPVFVAAIYAVFGLGNELPVYLIQILLHSLAVALVFRIAAGVAGKWAGAWAGAFFTFHPIVIWHARRVRSRSLFRNAGARRRH